jgi:hypothetical protein
MSAKPEHNMGMKDSKEHSEKTGKEATKRSGSTHSGTPNPGNPPDERATEHKSGYGGDRGLPRKSSDKSQGSE